MRENDRDKNKHTQKGGESSYK